MQPCKKLMHCKQQAQRGKHERGSDLEDWPLSRHGLAAARAACSTLARIRKQAEGAWHVQEQWRVNISVAGPARTPPLPLRASARQEF
jgi:hypothetical protein